MHFGKALSRQLTNNRGHQYFSGRTPVLFGVPRKLAEPCLGQVQHEREPPGQVHLSDTCSDAFPPIERLERSPGYKTLACIPSALKTVHKSVPRWQSCRLPTKDSAVRTTKQEVVICCLASSWRFKGPHFHDAQELLGLFCHQF